MKYSKREIQALDCVIGLQALNYYYSSTQVLLLRSHLF